MKKIPIEDAVKLLSPRVTVLVTTVDKQGNVNAAPYSWVQPVSFKPPLVYVGVGGRHKHTYQNIKATKEFVLNMVSEEFGQQAVNCERRHKPDEDLLEENGLHKADSKKVRPPRVRESRAVLECRLREFFFPKDSNYVIVIGEVVAAECEADEKGLPDLDKIRPLLHDQGDRFRSVGREIVLKRA